MPADQHNPSASAVDYLYRVNWCQIGLLENASAKPDQAISLETDDDAFCVLMRVPVQNDAALPPYLWRENTRLYEWSAETGARWGDRQDEN